MRTVILIGQEDINPNFKTTAYFGMKSLTKDEILKLLESNRLIFNEFKNKGILASTKFEYSFITKITFSPFEKNCVEGNKNQEDRVQAEANIKLVEDYFNQYRNKILEPYRIAFASNNNNDGKCVLYDINRFNATRLTDYMNSM